MIENVFQLQNTQCERDYNGCGWSWLVVKNDRPQKLLYHPEQHSEEMPEDWETVVRIDPENMAEIEATTEIWFGMASCWEFCGMHKIYP